DFLKYRISTFSTYNGPNLHDMRINDKKVAKRLEGHQSTVGPLYTDTSVCFIRVLLTVKRFSTSENSRSERVDAAFGEGKEVNGLYLEDPFRLKLYMDNVNSKKPLSRYLLLTEYLSIQPDLLYPDTNTN
ncbi:19941_t:CDS:2, partial [Rhizophagus irregularis]